MFNDRPVHGKDFLVSVSGDRQVLTIPETGSSHAGTISCVAENTAGKATCNAKLEIGEFVLNRSLIYSIYLIFSFFFLFYFYFIIESIAPSSNSDAKITTICAMVPRVINTLISEQQLLSGNFIHEYQRSNSPA